MLESERLLLLQELGGLKRNIELQIDEVAKLRSEAFSDLKIYQIKDANGNFLMTPLLLAKAQTMNAIIILATKE